MDDIFGTQVGTHFEGFVDSADAAAFNANLASLKTMWNNLETCANPALKPEFHSWFTEYKGPEVVAYVLPEVRKKAQISGHPLPLYTTNQSESINHMIKQDVQWKENKLPGLIKHLKVICDRHVAEAQKAIIHRGEWHFESVHSSFEIPEHL